MDLSVTDFGFEDAGPDDSGTTSSKGSGRALKKNQLTALEYLASLLLREIEVLQHTEERGLQQLHRGDSIDLYEEVQNFEASLIRNALIRAKGVQKTAAKLLSVKVTTLNVKIKRYKIGQPTESE